MDTTNQLGCQQERRSVRLQGAGLKSLSGDETYLWVSYPKALLLDELKIALLTKASQFTQNTKLIPYTLISQDDSGQYSLGFSSDQLYGLESARMFGYLIDTFTQFIVLDECEYPVTDFTYNKQGATEHE